MKSSINEFYSKKDSITEEIGSICNTKKTIEKFSTQIKEDVDKIKGAIDEGDRFKSLVKAIKDQLERPICEIKALDKTKEIDSILVGMVQQIQREASEYHDRIKKELTQHEEDVKEKICKYIDTIKNRLDSYKTNSVPNLEKKIKALVEPEGPEREGKLSKISKTIETFRIKYPNDRSYLSGGHILLDDVAQIRFLRPQKRDKHKVDKIQKTLGQILSELTRYKSRIGEINEKLSEYTKGNIENYKRHIESHKDKINLFEIIRRSNNTYEKQLESAKGDLFERAKLKELVEKYKENLVKGFRDLVDVVSSVTYYELKQIHQDIKGEGERVESIRKQLNNTKLLFQYLHEFKEKKKTFEGIEISGSGLEGIGQLISSMKKFRKGLRTFMLSIFGSSDTLFSNFERDENKTYIPTGSRLNYLPKTMSLDRRPLFELKNHIKKLEAIKEFKSTLTGITSGMRQLTNGTNQGNQASDVDGVLSWLGEIDGTLSKVYGPTNSEVTKMKETYSKYQEQINATSSTNGENIQGHVEEIKKIPDKILKLHSKVRYNIVLLNFAKSVNKTFEGVKEKGGNLKNMK